MNKYHHHCFYLFNNFYLGFERFVETGILRAQVQIVLPPSVLLAARKQRRTRLIWCRRVNGHHKQSAYGKRQRRVAVYAEK